MGKGEKEMWETIPLANVLNLDKWPVHTMLTIFAIRYTLQMV